MEENPQSEPPLSAMSAGDWIGVSLTLGALVYVFTLGAASKQLLGLYSEFGSADLPALTQFTIQPYVPRVASALVGLVLLMAFRKQSLRRRRGFIVTAFVLAAFFIATWHFAATLPLRQMTEMISGA